MASATRPTTCIHRRCLMQHSSVSTFSQVFIWNRTIRSPIMCLGKLNDGAALGRSGMEDF